MVANKDKYQFTAPADEQINEIILRLTAPLTINFLQKRTGEASLYHELQFY